MIQDMLAGLVAHLKLQAVVTDQVAQRVYALELPADQASAMPRKAIVLARAGGFAPGYAATLPLDAGQVDAYCYGATPYEAMEVRRALREALKDLERAKVGTVLLHWARPAGGFTEERDPQTTWPRVLESYSVMAAEPAAA